MNVTARLLASLLPCALIAQAHAAPDTILPGEPGAPITFAHAEAVNEAHPPVWIQSIRASAYLRGHEPHRAIDGSPDSDWRVSGPPPAPMVRGNWIEIELSSVIDIHHLEVHWLGERPYDYKVLRKIRDDFREEVVVGRSSGTASGLERIDLPSPVRTHVVRLEFATAEGGTPQGVREIRVGGLSYPASYPQAASPHAPVETAQRILYVEFERMPTWTVFNPKLPHANGGSALRLLAREDAFEGGHADFSIATAPNQDNWITLKVWEYRDVSMTTRGDLIVIETLDGDVTQRGRTYLPEMVTEQQHTRQSWYGTVPQPGRWAYAHYRIPAEVVRERSILKLRIQGVGNVRRDYPMRNAAPPIYRIRSGTSPSLD
jgi:hypothetical protein